MVIKPLDFLEHCYTPEDGAKVFERVYPLLKEGKKVTVSFEGVDSVPSSFVNAAFIQLLNHFTYDQIKSRLSFSRSSKQINEMLKKRFEFEAQRHAPLGT